MKLLWDDINNISEDDFGLIARKVIFKGRKVKFVPFLHIRQFTGQYLFLYFAMNLTKNGTNQIPKAGFD